jgi:hypothetical protein
VFLFISPSEDFVDVSNDRKEEEELMKLLLLILLLIDGEKASNDRDRVLLKILRNIARANS